jgi:hypothetical protein
VAREDETIQPSPSSGREREIEEEEIDEHSTGGVSSSDDETNQSVVAVSGRRTYWSPLKGILLIRVTVFEPLLEGWHGGSRDGGGKSNRSTIASFRY